MRDDRRASLIRRLVSLYPRAWRVRYGEEFSTLLAETPLTFRRIVDVSAAALRERARSAVGLGACTTTWQRAYGAYRRSLLRALAVAVLTSTAGVVLGAWLLRHGWTDDNIPDWFFVVLLWPCIRGLGIITAFKRRSRWEVRPAELAVLVPMMVLSVAVSRLNQHCYGPPALCAINKWTQVVYMGPMWTVWLVNSTPRQMRIWRIRFKLAAHRARLERRRGVSPTPIGLGLWRVP
jgi:hypothetical protein